MRTRRKRPPPTCRAICSWISSSLPSGFLRAAHRDRAYSFQFCSPTRSSLQSGRYPSHVNDKNADVTAYNPADPVSGFAAIPRNMTGIASKLKAAGYMTHQVGKWDAGMATWDHTPHGRGYDTSLGCADSERPPRKSPAARMSALDKAWLLACLVSSKAFTVLMRTCIAQVFPPR